MKKPGPEDTQNVDLKYPVCSIRDVLSGFYPATVEQSTRTAIRNFAMAVNGNAGVIGFAPGDFTLFHIGYFNTEKGILEPLTPIVQLASGLEVYGAKDAES